MPSQEEIGTWLEEHKDEFIKARKERTRRQGPAGPVRRIQNIPRAAAAVVAQPIVRVAHHPAVRRVLGRQFGPVPDGGIMRHARRAARAARRTVAGLLGRAAVALQVPADGPAAILEPGYVRPVAPPLDERFFHPNGQLYTVFKYLTAQIPLPRQWVKWAIENGVYEVEGRGDIREPEVYIADDNFDYGALYDMIHYGHFKTGRLEIDIFPDHWLMVEGHRDRRVNDLLLHRFPPDQVASRRHIQAEDGRVPDQEGLGRVVESVEGRVEPSSAPQRSASPTPEHDRQRRSAAPSPEARAFALPEPISDDSDSSPDEGEIDLSIVMEIEEEEGDGERIGQEVEEDTGGMEDAEHEIDPEHEEDAEHVEDADAGEDAEEEEDELEYLFGEPVGRQPPVPGSPEVVESQQPEDPFEDEPPSPSPPSSPPQQNPVDEPLSASSPSSPPSSPLQRHPVDEPVEQRLTLPTSQPTPGRAPDQPGTFGLSADFYDSSSSDSSPMANSSPVVDTGRSIPGLGMPDPSPESAAAADAAWRRQQAIDHLANSRAALRELIEARGSPKVVRSPPPRR